MMFERSATFMKWCTKIRPHKWRCDVEHVRHIEGRKEEKDEMGFARVAWPKEKNWIHFFLCNELQQSSNIYESDVQKSGHINEGVMLNLWDTLKEEKKKRMKKYKVHHSASEQEEEKSQRVRLREW